MDRVCSWMSQHHHHRLLLAQPFFHKIGGGRNGAWRSRRCCPVAATKPVKGGTRSLDGKKIKVLQEGDKSATLRDKETTETANVKLLSRIEQLKLLSQVEKAGLLSAAERFGFSLSKIERLGLLSKAEGTGLLSAAIDLNTPGNLLILALGFFITGPIVVYYVPEDSGFEIGLQIVLAIVAIMVGTAAFTASKFLSTLQKSDQ